MKRIFSASLTALIALVLQGCHTFTYRSGKKWHYFNPATDKVGQNTLDTNKFIKERFSLAHFNNKVAYEHNRRIVESIQASDIDSLLRTGKRYYIYFWNTGCHGAVLNLHKLDSMAKEGELVLVISLWRKYGVMDKTLQNTAFSQYPYYIIDDEKYTNVMLLRKIKFIQEACSNCYQEYKDEVMDAYYMLIEKGTKKVIMHGNDNATNVLL